MKVKMIILAAITLLFIGCKEDNWMDWKALNEQWMRQNATQAGVRTTHTGLQYKVINQGLTGRPDKPGTTSTVTVDYKGSLINGKVFDSAEGASFMVSQVVAGFAEGLKKMNQHGDYILYIPWDLGYGEDGTEAAETAQAFIPPYSTLIFEVHLSDYYSN